MTYPPQGGPWQPNDPNQQPGQPGQPQQGYPQQQPGQPGYPQQGYPQTGPQAAQHPMGYDQYGQPVQQGYGYPQPPKRKKTGLLVGSIIAAVALAAGGVAVVIATGQADVNVGSANPQDAALKLVSAVGGADIAGVLTSLPPAESALLRDLNSQATEELKRLEIYKKDADPDKVAGLNITTTNLKFDDSKKIEINDHLTINMLVDGQIEMNSNMRDLPLTEKFIELAFPKGIDKQASGTQKLDIGKQVTRSKKPIRIATVKVNNQWYPSLFYTLADYALVDAKKSWPDKSIPAKGAGSPGDAVREMANAAVDANLERVIELLPPDELGALHDTGPVLLQAIGGKAKPSGAKIIKLDTDTSSVTGGTKVTLKELEVEADGDRVRVVRKGDCYEASFQGESQKFCATDATKEIGGSNMPAGAKTAVTHLTEGLFKNGLGIVTTQVDGKWYVSPGRSFFEIVLTALRSLQPSDVEALIKAGR